MRHIRNWWFWRGPRGRVHRLEHDMALLLKALAAQMPRDGQ
jgi:hypothetical protein